MLKKSIPLLILVFCLLHQTFLFAINQEKGVDQTYLEANIRLENGIEAYERFLKLNDGSYWKVKTEDTLFNEDLKTATDWWRFDLIEIQKGTDKTYPYLLDLLHN